MTRNDVLKCVRLAAVLLALLFTVSGSVWSQAGSPPPPPMFAWVEMTGDGAEIRAILVDGQTCPEARVDGRRVLLSARTAMQSANKGFPRMCTALLPKAARKVSVAGHALPTPRAEVRSIAILGDTGCRVTAGEAQDCQAAWPFPRIAGFLARKHPDLVIHVGDFYYREKCLPAEQHCENWPNWKLDFFDPANPLFRTSPWIFARGNHEACPRAAEGWFNYLDAGPGVSRCPEGRSAAFLVPIGGLTLGVVDTASVTDSLPGDRKLAIYKQDLDKVWGGATSPLWIVTHKPPFVRGLMNFEEQAAEKEMDPDIAGLDLILAGHLHLFSSLDFGPQRAAQLIVGDSGTRLMVAASKQDAAITQKDPAAMMQGTKTVDGKPAQYTVKGRFGYFLLTRTSAKSTAWTGTLFGDDDQELARCSLQGRALQCVASPVAKAARP